MPPLLSLATLSSAPARVQPVLQPQSLAIGIVHLGVGAFHRAHQAVYTERAAELSGDDGWGICGVSQRSAGAADALAAQDGLYSVVCADGTETSVRLIASLRQALFAERDAEALSALLADSRVKVVTLTVTEKGYRFNSSTRSLRRDDPDLLADAQGRPPTSVLGQLARGLEHRRRTGAGPLTILSCDNIPGNGTLLARLVIEMLSLPGSRFDKGLAEWVRENTRYPCTMVDRIVPATTAQWQWQVSDVLGLEDRCPVVTEPFKQWVIEDDFASARPRWELAGAELVDDVAPYESLKLRTLNGAHSALAYLGLLAGCTTIAEALQRPDFETFVRRMLDDEVRATLALPRRVDFQAYRDSVLVRFGNPHLPYLCTQVATDGSQKLPQRLLGTVRDMLAIGQVPYFALTVLAAWVRCIGAGTEDTGRPFELSDPLAQKMRLTMGAATDARRSIEGALSLNQVFGDDLPANEGFCRALTERFEALSRRGAQRVVSEMVSQ